MPGLARISSVSSGVMTTCWLRATPAAIATIMIAVVIRLMDGPLWFTVRDGVTGADDIDGKPGMLETGAALVGEIGDIHCVGHHTTSAAALTSGSRPLDPGLENAGMNRREFTRISFSISVIQRPSAVRLSQRNASAPVTEMSVVGNIGTSHFVTL